MFRKSRLITRLILLIPLFYISCVSSENVNQEISLPLENTKWILKILNGKKIFTPESDKDIYIQFSTAGKRINGYAGCNTFFGTYSKDKNIIAIGPLASTEMFCESMMDIENELLKTLGNTKKYKIKGKYLQLYDSEKIIAKLEGISENN